MERPILYVIAGPNGIGKTTSDFYFIPGTIPIINSDEIAAEAKRTGLITGNTQEYANGEAIRLMNEYLNKSASFGFETNLSDVDTWKFLLKIQATGYQLHIIYVSTNSLEALNARINNRVKEGGHFVRPDIVEERYLSGLQLLNHYFDKPDRLQLFDNSESMLLEVQLVKGKALSDVVLGALPKWIVNFLPNVLGIKSPVQTKERDLNSIEEVRRKYNEARGQGAQKKDTQSGEEPNNQDRKK
jgi:predicted ABC-type ATPase